jgi:CBS domain-containing protein
MTIARLIKGRSAQTITCEVTTTVRDAVALLADKRIGAVPVLENGSVAGIFSERDVIRQLRNDGAAMLDRLVGEVMTAPAVTVELDCEVLAALGLMTKRRIRHLPVFDNGHMVDFISIGDLVKYRIDHIESEAAAMRSYIETA